MDNSNLFISVEDKDLTKPLLSSDLEILENCFLRKLQGMFTLRVMKNTSVIQNYLTLMT